MATKYFYITLLCIIPFISAALVPVMEGDKIKISVGTGSFCTFTVDFITNQLVPTYEPYKDYLEIEFVPWGSATLNEDGSVTCSRGHADCWANRLHRCVLDVLKDDQDKRVEYMACEYSDRAAFLRTSYECVHKIGLNLVDIDYCVRNPQLDDLDEKAAEAARPIITETGGIPTVVFNGGTHNATLYSAARTRLRSLSCFSLAEGIVDSGISGCTIV